jgi:hypothetical protein
LDRNAIAHTPLQAGVHSVDSSNQPEIQLDYPQPNGDIFPRQRHNSDRITSDSCWPVGTQEAKRIKLIDNNFSDCLLSFRHKRSPITQTIGKDLDRKNKIWQQDEQIKPLAAYKFENWSE